MAVFHEMEWRSVPPDAVSYNAVISACDRAALPGQALLCVEAMTRRRLMPTAITYSAAMSAVAKSGDWAWAIGLFSCAGGPNKERRRDSVCYSVAVASCEKGGRWGGALQRVESTFRLRA